MVQRRQRMRPAILPALAGREELIAPTCPEPFCILQPHGPQHGAPGSMRWRANLHMAVEYEDATGAPYGNTSYPTTRNSKPLYSWWGKSEWCLSVADRPPQVTVTFGKFRVMDGDVLNRAIDRMVNPLTPKEAA